MKPMYTNYDKLSDNIVYLGSKLSLRLNVYLSTKSDNGRSRFFHTEYKYEYKYGGTLYSMRRCFDYFLSLTKYDEDVSIMIRVQDMIIMREKLEEVAKWFSSNNVYAIKDRKLIIKTKQKPIVVAGLAGAKYLQFDPVVLTWESNEEQSPGLRITLSDPAVFADITVDKFYALLYIFQTINLYEAASLLVNYFGRPELGTNQYELPASVYFDESDELNKSKETEERPRSFFDKK